MKLWIKCVRNGVVGCMQKGKIFYCADCESKKCPPEDAKVVWCFRNISKEVKSG